MFRNKSAKRVQLQITTSHTIRGHYSGVVNSAETSFCTGRIILYAARDGDAGTDDDIPSPDRKQSKHSINPPTGGQL